MTAAGPALGALGGLLAVLTLREVVSAWPSLSSWSRAALEPFLRAGREGYEPSKLEGRRLGLLAGLVGAATAWILVGWALAPPVALAGPAVSRWLVAVRRRRYLRRVEASLSEIAHALADSLSAGRSLRAAMGELSGSLEGAAATELSLLATELELGSPTAVALRSMSNRIESPRVAALVQALLAGRESGGDLAELMRRFAGGADAHERALRESRAATAQARFTGLLVVGMPAAGAAFAELLRPGFLAGLFESPASIVMVGMALALQAIGFVAIRRLAREEAR